MLPRVSYVNGENAEYLLFSTNDLISNTIFKEGQWEPHLLKVSEMFYTGVEAPLIMDVGANLGAYSIPIAKSVQSIGGSVIGFEPQRIVYYQLCGNIFLNRLDNYYAYNQAISDSNGFIHIPEVDYNRNSNIGAFSLDKSYRELHGIEGSIMAKTTNVPTITLDSFETEKLVSLLKIDVEGFELNVLKGAVSFIERNKFPPILFEAWSFDFFKKGREELFKFLQHLGYHVTGLNTSDFVAQHPENSVYISFTPKVDGVIVMHRVK